MAFKIISNRDKDGNFIVSTDYWKPDKVEELLKKYNPNGKMKYSLSKQKQESDKESEKVEK